MRQGSGERPSVPTSHSIFQQCDHNRAELCLKLCISTVPPHISVRCYAVCRCALVCAGPSMLACRGVLETLCDCRGPPQTLRTSRSDLEPVRKPHTQSVSTARLPPDDADTCFHCLCSPRYRLRIARTLMTRLFLTTHPEDHHPEDHHHHHPFL